MAPEIVLGSQYFGPAVDLFAAGVLLFYLVLEKPPFIKATVQDDYYKTIAANRYDLFWKIHLKKFEAKESISDSFKELINFMLASNVIERGSLSEIRQHEWTQGPVATYDEVVEEFSKRQELIEKQALDNSAPIPKFDNLDDLSSQITQVHRSIDGDEIQENIE